MRLLLDTHILIWALSDPVRLTAPAQSAITAPENDVFVSAVSAWEIAIKRALGRIEFPIEELDTLLGDMGISPLPITIAHAVAAGGLPRYHDDPFDRMLIAQARLDGMMLMSDDSAVRRYGGPIFGQPAP